MALVDVSDLTKTFGTVTAVNGISFSLTEGRCVALLGPNGAGKSSTLNMLAGLLRPTSGAIRFAGPAEGADHRSLIGYVPQQVAIYGWMTGFEYLRMVGELFGLTRSAAAARGRELLAELGLEAAQNRRVGGYSGGMKQRLGVAQALIHHPRLLILDEPVSGLDPVGRRDVLELLKRLKSASTILFSTHVLPDAEEVSDDILIIRDGEIVVSDSLEALRDRHERPIVEIAFDSETIARQWLEPLRSVGGTIELRGNAVRCGFPTRAAARDGAASVFHVVAEQQVPARRVEIAETSLEEMFLQAVQS